MDRHQSTRHLRRKFKDSDDPAERMAWREFTESGRDTENYQDPQVCVSIQA